MEVPKELVVALELSQRTVARGGRVAIFAKEMVRLLDRAINQIESTGGPSSVQRPAGGGPEHVVYVVDQDRGHGESLAEHRTSGKSKPFRCPKAIYDVLAEVLATAERPLGLDEIMTAVEKVTGDRPADHQVRVALRLWLHVEPPLVTRNRARYRHVTSTSIAPAATDLWVRLKIP